MHTDPPVTLFVALAPALGGGVGSSGGPGSWPRDLSRVPGGLFRASGPAKAWGASSVGGGRPLAASASPPLEAEGDLAGSKASRELPQYSSPDRWARARGEGEGEGRGARGEGEGRGRAGGTAAGGPSTEGASHTAWTPCVSHCQQNCPRHTERKRAGKPEEREPVHFTS